MKQLFIASLVLVSSACGSSSDELPPTVDCSTVQPVPTFSQVDAFQSVCTNCHSSTKSGSARKGAPGSINFDQYDSASAHARQAAIEVNVGSMPPVSADLSVTSAQKTALFDWALCGTPQ
jgi:uncharacterized membrane protein